MCIDFFKYITWLSCRNQISPWLKWWCSHVAFFSISTPHDWSPWRHLPSLSSGCEEVHGPPCLSQLLPSSHYIHNDSPPWSQVWGSNYQSWGLPFSLTGLFWQFSLDFHDFRPEIGFITFLNSPFCEFISCVVLTRSTRMLHRLNATLYDSVLFTASRHHDTV